VEGRFSSDAFGRKSAVGYLFSFGKRIVELIFAGLYGDVAQAGRTNGWISD
jgi:hypothetical protein